MQIATYSTKSYDREFFDRANQRYSHDISYFESRLTKETAQLAKGYPAVCAFVNDVLDRPVLELLAAGGTRWIGLRSAGFNNVDLDAAQQLKLSIARVPAYSPYAVAEYAVGLMLMLNRKMHRAFNRVREGNFSLEGLLGFDFHGRTVGIVGTGQIGSVVARILHGFGCKLLGFDSRENADCLAMGMQYVDKAGLLSGSDVISLHCPLTPQTHYWIDDAAIQQMRQGVMLINTSRGAVVDTVAVIRGLKSGRIGALGLDVYEEEVDYFFEDRSAQVIADDVLARLLTFTNVIVSSHQAFFTREALTAIAETTLKNLSDLEHTGTCANLVVR